ncbi:MAG: M20/M25/M40 family metallo-hydrolase [Cyanobacteria bacterium K_DeepCast_150m_m2_101]|nr:M20/M25/M40 family metallo-hydrolase [Cyanobacteria bacterium M_surface_9_m1_291]MBM5820541.1 M20/M25/M40 family metallo-hydrolase [Cyanobacteria bacterium K_DeepCast_150m_m2_101]
MADDLQRRLLTDLHQFAVPRHARWDPLGLLGVRNALRERLGALGPLEEHHFGSGSDVGTNLILRLPGREPQRRPLLVGAHYDGPLHSPGADDNASGLVALLELARRWAADPPRRPVWLVAFDQEEWGMVGSAALAAQLKQAAQPLKLMVSLEMLAYTSPSQNYPHPAMRAVYGDRGDFIALVANAGAGLLLPGLARSMGRHVPTKVLPVPNGGRGIQGVRLSDHSPFWDQGYDALMVTDTSFMRNPHYHQMSDTVDTLDLVFYGKVIHGLDASLSHL